MKIKQLEYLMKIVECGSITQAAQQLYVSQPSITKAISGLEDEYGFPILVRKARGVELTPQGREFVCNARSVLAAVHSLEKTSADARPPKIRLSIAAQQLDFIYELFTEACLCSNSKNLYFNLIETERNDVVRQILDGKADLGFAVRTNQDPKDFLWNSEAKRLDLHTLDNGGIFAAVGPKSPLWGRSVLQMDEVEICDQVAVDLEEQAKQAVWADSSYYSHINGNHIIFCNTVSACEYFLLHTAAVSFVSPWTKGHFTSPDIHVIPVESDPETNHLIWLKRAGEPLNANEIEFLSRLYHYLGKANPITFA